MPKQKITDAQIYYESYGQGDTIVYLQSTLGGINPGAWYFAGRLSGHFRVIIWDGPNNGQSDVVLRNTPSEYHLFCACLKELLDGLHISSAHLAGCSGGGEMALLFARLYPETAKSIALYRPTDTTSSVEAEIIQNRFCRIAEFAKNHTMEEVAAYSADPPQTRFGHCASWIADLYRRDKDKLLEISQTDFAGLMQSWGDWMGRPTFYRANLSDEDLHKIDIPALIAPCADEYHPESIAQDLANHLPNAVYIPSGKHRTETEIYHAPEEEHPFGGFVQFVNDYENFVLSACRTL